MNTDIIRHKSNLDPLADRFAGASTLDEAIESAPENRDFWRALRKRAQAPAEFAERLRSLPRRHLLVLSEDWCGDAVHSLPFVQALAEQLPQIDMRILERDRNPDLMDAHLTGTSRSIPVVMVLDEDFREVGWWGPRPEPLQRWMLSDEARRLNPDDRYRKVRRWYARDQGRTTLEEVTELLKRTA